MVVFICIYDKRNKLKSHKKTLELCVNLHENIPVSNIITKNQTCLKQYR